MSDNSVFLADKDAPVCYLDVKTHFNALSLKQKFYAHHFSRASHWGTRVILRQVSFESESIYDIIILIHKSIEGNYSKLDDLIDKKETKLYLEYAAQFLSNLGNFKSFGDVKFIPGISIENFEKIASIDEKSKELFNNVKEAIYSIEPAASTLLGYSELGHVTSYYKGSITKDEIEKIHKESVSRGILPENTRIFKTEDGKFDLLIASGDKTSDAYPDSSFEVETVGTVNVVYGDSYKEFTHIANELESAIKYAGNPIQVRMISEYVKSFKTGSMEAHKESQRQWVKDIGPAVETNIGFIETYRDPAGIRGEWEGLVAMVNKERTEKFGELVSSAKDYISLLPWSKPFEKDVFTPPDFTSLEVLTFAGSGIPAGINIPNYDDVRLNVGFKNVSLGNVLAAKPPNQKISFISEDTIELYRKLQGPAFEVQVGIHELLGHGTGKLLSELKDGSFNFDIKNPPISDVTGKPITTYYKKGQTWGSLFGAIAGSYEECRAECVAMYLVTNYELLSIFGHKTKEEADNIIKISYLQMARAGLVGLENWDPKSNKWGQPHMQARFSIFKQFLNAGEDFIKLSYTKDDYSDLVIKIDESKIQTVGKKAVGDYLQKLHIFKTSGDFENGKKLYAETTAVTPELAKFRDIVIKSKLPRSQYVQANTIIEGSTISLQEYQPSAIGLIQSFVDRNV